MLNDIDFIIIGYCNKCGKEIYEHFENGIYVTCFCKFHKLPNRKLKLAKNNQNKFECKYENEEEKEIYGRTS